MSIKFNHGSLNRLLLISVTALGLVLTGCGTGKIGNSSSPRPDNTPDIKMDIPDTLTGGTESAGVGGKSVDGVAAISKAGTGQPCHYIGDKDNDHFRNGYKITKLLVSAIATWSCIGDLLIDVSNFVDHDGVIHTTDNDFSSPGYKPKDPTHYSVTDDSDSQTTVRLYYGYNREAPPLAGEDPQFYISWNESADDVLEGRMIVDVKKINPLERKDDDPNMLRMDFEYATDQKEANMYLSFDGGNQWAEGFRIHLVRDMNANPLEQVYTARGRIKMKRQFLRVKTIPEIPTVNFFTVSNRAGKGAAIADFVDVALPLKLGSEIVGSHLGNYLIEKHDSYFFDAVGEPEYVNKTVPNAVYKGDRTTLETGGSWEPFDPSLEMIKTELGLPGDYFTGSKCGDIGSDCTQLIESIFAYHDDSWGPEHNQGTDPGDWRTDALTAAEYLPSVYPDGAVDWIGVFDFVFTPKF